MSYNLIFDLNNLFYQIAYRNGDSSGKYLSTEEDRNAFIDDVVEEIDNFIFNLKEKPKLIIFCKDPNSKIWRDEYLDDTEYKGTRSKTTPKFDIVGFHSIFDDFFKFLKKDYHCFCDDQIESDDYMSVLSKYFYQKEGKTIIFSADSDIKQLINSKDDFNSFVIIYDFLKKKFFTDKIIPDDNFFPEDFIFDNKRSAIDTIKSNYETINPGRLLFVKVLSGDRGDNISSCFLYQKGSQFFNYTEERAKKLYDENNYKFSVFFGDKEKRYEIIKKIFESLDLKVIKENKGTKERLEFTNEIANSINEKIERNLKVIWLNFSLYPENIKKTITNSINNEFSKKGVTLNEELLNLREFLNKQEKFIFNRKKEISFIDFYKN